MGFSLDGDVAGLGARVPGAQVRNEGWFARLLRRSVQRHAARRRPLDWPAVPNHQTAEARAAIRTACLKSAILGGGAALVSTGAAVVSAETKGLAAIGAIPLAAAAMGADAVCMSIVHVDLACRLAEIFGVRLDADSPHDLFRLYALVFKRSSFLGTKADPGRVLVGHMLNLPEDEVGQDIGRLVLGESVLRNLIPFLGIPSSAIMNWIVTRRLGDTVRRYMTYERALTDAFAQAARAVSDHKDLLVEGMWFIFSADGALTPEEAVTLARLLEEMPPAERARVIARFTDDEADWVERLETIPESARDGFLRALEVAAAVDKRVELPERKVLHRAAHHLGRMFDRKRLERMIADFESHGVFTG